jgi:hypothetical protein
MEWVTISERDLPRVGLLSEVLDGRRMMTSATTVLELSVREAHRL